VLVLGRCGVLLGMLAAKAGAGRVTVVERSPLQYRQARALLLANAAQHPELAAVDLAPCALHCCRVAGGEGATAGGAAAGGGGSDGSGGMGAPAALHLLPSRAGVLVTDLLDHSVLGQGLLAGLRYCAQHLLHPGCRVLPEGVQVWGCLVERRVGRVQGFDLSPLNKYRWHPGVAPVDLARCLDADGGGGGGGGGGGAAATAAAAGGSALPPGPTAPAQARQQLGDLARPLSAPFPALHLDL
jgi:hypothetical protein